MDFSITGEAPGATSSGVTISMPGSQDDAMKNVKCLEEEETR